MLALSLADFIDENDPCTPGSPSYSPNDPICAAVAPEIVFTDDSVPCTPGTPGCGPQQTLNPTGPAAAPGMSTALSNIGWKPVAIVGAVGALGAAVYFIGKALSKRPALAGYRGR
jgi:hypothetical protein